MYRYSVYEKVFLKIVSTGISAKYIYHLEHEASVGELANGKCK